MFLTLGHSTGDRSWLMERHSVEELRHRRQRQQQRGCGHLPTPGRWLKQPRAARRLFTGAAAHACTRHARPHEWHASASIAATAHGRGGTDAPARRGCNRRTVRRSWRRRRRVPSHRCPTLSPPPSPCRRCAAPCARRGGHTASVHPKLVQSLNDGALGRAWLVTGLI
jgi:hypothetical protein